MKLMTLLAAIGIMGVMTLATPAYAMAPEGDAAHAEDAAHGGGHGSPSVIAEPKAGLIPAIMALVSFGVVAGVLYTQVWPKIVKGLDERASKITEEIAAAEAARSQAKEALDEYEKSLAEARAEAQSMLDETKNKQAELASQLRAKADAELSEMKERALKDIEAAKKQALNEIYNESVNLATHMASKILQREVTADDQQRLVEESLSELQAQG